MATSEAPSCETRDAFGEIYCSLATGEATEGEQERAARYIDSLKQRAESAERHLREAQEQIAADQTGATR